MGGNSSKFRIDAPARGAFAVTPSDSLDLNTVARGFYVGVTGNVKITTLAGEEVTFVAVAASVVLPVHCTKIWATGTTASSIVALY